MTTIKSITILDKLIEKTKNNSIRWEKYSESDISIKPLPISPLDTLPSISKDIISMSYLNSESSYICSFNGGTFALLLYTNTLHNELYLRVQTENSAYSKNYASTLQENDVTEAAKLKRLYNLVNALYTSIDIDEFVENFLKNE